MSEVAPLLGGGAGAGGGSHGGSGEPPVQKAPAGSAPIPRYGRATPAEERAKERRRLKAAAARIKRGEAGGDDGDESSSSDEGGGGFGSLLRSVLRLRLPRPDAVARSWSTVDGLRDAEKQRLVDTMETPIPARYEKYHQPSQEEQRTGFSPFIGVCFTINFIVGSGFLGMPKAFVSAGIGLGFGLLLAFTLMCNLTKDYILETMCRAEAVTEFALKTSTSRANPEIAAAIRREEDVRERRLSEGAIRDTEEGGVAFGDSSSVPGTGTELRTSTAPKREASVGTIRRLHALHTYTITQRKFELTELCELFLGKRFKNCYIFVLSMYMLGVLWSFSSVFATSAAENIPVFFLNDGKTCDIEEDPHGCLWNYRFFLGIFAAVVIPLSCLELKEQVCVQVTMSMARFLVMGLLMLTVSFAETCPDGKYAFENTQSHSSEINWFKLSGIATMVPVAVYAQMFHSAIPVLSQPVKKKTALPGVFGWSFVITTLSYTGIGVLVAMYFGSTIEGQCNLMWGAPTEYIGCGVPGETRPVWAAFFGYFILVFPALDVMSAYPLNAITMGNNLLSAWAGDRAPKVERNRRIVTMFRLLAAGPPLVGAAFVNRLDTILSYTGLIGFIVTFWVPCLLVWSSRKRCAELFPDDVGMRLPYTSWFDFAGLNWFVLAFTLGTAAYIFYLLATGAS